MALEKVELTLSDFVENFLYLNGDPFSLDDYPHMRRIYNTDADRTVLKFSRQCIYEDQNIFTYNRGFIKAKDLQVNDQIISFDPKKALGQIAYIKAVWDNGNKPVFRIKTNLGSEIYITDNHPVLTLFGWKLPTDLKVGDPVMGYNRVPFTEGGANRTAVYNKHGIRSLLNIDNPDGNVWDTNPDGDALRKVKEKRPASITYHDTRLEAEKTRLLHYITKHNLRARVNPQVRIYYDYEKKKWGVEVLKGVGKNTYKSHIFRKFRSRFYEEYPEFKKVKTNDFGVKTIRRLISNGGEVDERLVMFKTWNVQIEEIVEIENIGHKNTIAVQITRPNTIVIDGIITHNTAKSTTLANIILAKAITTPNYKQLYVSPAVAQTQEFARDKLEPVMANSPIITERFTSNKLVKNVLKKEFTNGSVINLRYALLNADRIRGISANANYFDECQDLLKDVIEVTEKTMARSIIKKSYYVGTPKRTKGTLADFWFKSTQYEYAVKSSASGHWNILDENNIGLNGLIDKKSGLPLDLRNDKGMWVSAYSDPKAMPAMEGYRVCLLHFAHAPWVRWDRDVIYAMENTSKALFYNETLGLEYDAGSMPITREEIIRACNEDYSMSEEPDKGAVGRTSIMGIDYGPVNSENSHTVITIMQVRDGILQVVYAKKFLGSEASYSFIHEEIPRLMKKWNCVLLAADYGMGEAPNSEFRNKLGFDKVHPYMYLPTQKEVMRYNPKSAAYTVNRNFMMNKFFDLVKKGKLKFPSWDTFYPFAADIQNVIVEFDEEKNTTKYSNIGPDDFVHSTVFSMISTLIVNGMGEHFL